MPSEDKLLSRASKAEVARPNPEVAHAGHKG